MKRHMYGDPVNGDPKMKKKMKGSGSGSEPEDGEIGEEIIVIEGAKSVLLDENLLYEILKHVDARTLGVAACVSKQWHKTAEDERLWELICTKHWSNVGCVNNQFRSVVLALGGFRRLHSECLWPLSKPSPVSAASAASSSASAWPSLPPPPAQLVPAKSARTRSRNDEVQLSLSLLSIRYYERMNFKKQMK